MRLLTFAAFALTAALAPLAAQAYDGEQFVVCNLNPNGDNFLALHSCGSSKCKMLRKLGPGTFVMSHEPYSEKGWRWIWVQHDINDQSYAGQSGWVYDKYICKVQY